MTFRTRSELARLLFALLVTFVAHAAVGRPVEESVC